MGRSCRVRLAAFVVVPVVLGAGLASAVVRPSGSPWSARAATAWADKVVGSSRSTDESEHFVVVRGVRDGVDQATATDDGGRPLLDRLERYFALDVESAGVIGEQSDITQHKILVILTRTWADPALDAWADGSVSDDLGVLQIAPEAARSASWDVSRALATTLLELGSSAAEVSAPLGATTASFLATLAEPGEAADVAPFLRAANLRWASASHRAGGWPLLQYVVDRDGVAVLGRLWRESRTGEDPLETYRRVAKISVQELGRRIGEFAARSITGDFSNRSSLEHYLARPDAAGPIDPTTPVEAVDAATGHFRVPPALAPAVGGFNVVRLVPDEPGASVRVRVRGHAEGDPTAAWTSGLVAVLDGVARYGALAQGTDEEIELAVQPGEDVFLVVAATPSVLPGVDPADGYPQAARYPFELGIAGAAPAGSGPAVVRPVPAAGGHWHAFGGGWVSDEADVAASVYVAEHAVVGAAARLSGDVRVEGRAVVEGGAVLSGTVVVREMAVVRATAVLSGHVVVGGDAVVGLICASGTYLSFTPGRSCDGLSPDADATMDPAPFDTASMAVTGAGTTPGRTPGATPPPLPVVVPGPAASASPATPPPPAPTTDPARVTPAPTPSDVALPAPVAAPPPCTAVYTVANSWPGGYQAEITVTAGPLAIDGWRVSWSMADGQTIGNMWGATAATDGRAATAASLSWNSRLAAGASTTFGLTGSTTVDPAALTASCGRSR
ncbi:MAG: DUF6055 domain-containing protein [Cellulomonas sp.]